ncbi:Lrp/AsnC family transcriptional regulator [Nocardioides sp. YR527]|uniref:Lrp/AsnC family transcriptional regulator n=1 Tax=Nocardioides sp. YR527 TaxID=1881028 RepID=UPI000A7250C8|nr:Lrp/AsnC family transcriptional regulator [Nocardioides sp. YR527]
MDEQDLALLHALQIAPRTTWTAAAEILETSAARLAERWLRLRSQGLAWVTAYPSPLPGWPVIGFMEIECPPEDWPATVRALCADPRVASVEETARNWEVRATVFARDLSELTSFMREDLAALSPRVRCQTYFATTVHQHGSSWRLDALDAAQRRGFEAIAAEQRSEPGVTPPLDAGPLIEALSKDGRATAADLARATGRNPASVRRQLPRLLASGMLTFRCEVSQVASHWPVNCTYFVRIAADQHDRTVAALRTLPELRQCVATTGSTNLMFTVWVRSLERLLDLEFILGERLPWLQIINSSVAVRTRKRMGWILDEHGRALHMVPLGVTSSG